MRSVRKIARAVVFLGVTAVLYPALLTVMLLLVPLPRMRRRARNAIFRTWSRLCLRIAGGKLTVEGQPPEAPFFLVSNHLSYIDILALSAVLDTFFVAKSEIRSWPLFGVLCRTVGTIFVDRELRRDVTRVNALIQATLDDGYGVVLFPEGTSSQGYEVETFRSALLAYPASQSMEVHAASLSYATPPGETPAHLSICWWGDAPFFAHFLRLLGLRGFDARVRFDSVVEVDEDRKRLARRLRERVDAGFERVVTPECRASETGF